MTPMVSVVTPTWQRHNLLVSRCMPSVQAQSYPSVEHVIVCDGPDRALPSLVWSHSTDGPHPVTFECLPSHDPERHWGHHCRNRGLELASGELIAYCDDDDALRPNHVEVLAKALVDNPQLGFVYSRMISHQPSGEHLVGDCMPPVFGQIGSPMIMHRKGLASWDAPDIAEDWKLVERWLKDGIPYARVDEDTVDVWPSTYAGLGL